jgi:hypothetical protein
MRASAFFQSFIFSGRVRQDDILSLDRFSPWCAPVISMSGFQQDLAPEEVSS